MIERIRKKYAMTEKGAKDYRNPDAPLSARAISQ